MKLVTLVIIDFSPIFRLCQKFSRNRSMPDKKNFHYKYNKYFYYYIHNKYDQGHRVSLLSLYKSLLWAYRLFNQHAVIKGILKK